MRISIVLRSLVFLALIAGALTSVSAQSKLGKEIRDREIEWSDFAGDVPENARWHAYTDWVTTYRFSRPSIEGGRARVRLSVQLFLEATTWVRPDKKSDRLLEHERGHYNIGRICARQIEDAVNSAWFSVSNYAKEIDDIYWRTIDKCKQFERQYDTETKHYHDEEQQALWNKKIADLLKK
jgi:hypothetical protein